MIQFSKNENFRPNTDFLYSLCDFSKRNFAEAEGRWQRRPHFANYPLGGLKKDNARQQASRRWGVEELRRGRPAAETLIVSTSLANRDQPTSQYSG